MKTNTLFNCFVAVLLTLFAASNSIFAQSSTSASGQFSLQGLLTTTTGVPIADGQHSLTVNVYANGSATASFTETVNVMSASGLFTTMIGANGSGGANLTVKPGVSYQLGISVDGGAELSPKLQIGSSISSLTANLAANADSVGGFTVSVGGNAAARANTLFTLNSLGKIDSTLLQGSLVTSINGMTGPITLQGGGNLGITTNGNTLTLNVTGGGSGSLTLPFAGTTNLAAGSTAFSITNSLGGSAATFINTATGNALNITANSGSAINASSTGGVGSLPTLNVSNTAGTAIKAVATTTTGAALSIQNMSATGTANVMTALNAAGGTILSLNGNGQAEISATAGPALSATTNAASSAALQLQNTSAATGANLISGLNSTGSAVLSVAGSGQTTITATGGPALNATTNATGSAALQVQNMSAAGGANLISALNAAGTTVLSVAGTGQTSITSTAGTALNVSAPVNQNAISLNGGLKITGGAVGTGTIALGQLTATINNAMVQANSIILVTVSAAGAAALPVQVASQANGSFVVSAITSLPGVTGALTFNYLIINQ